ncbi:tRNA (adenosine(37)-N6)-dimethylallyltransferase MiaA [Puia dinghuensis]|uniref:tRNA dimethylallyltransferase n=1 Tax=Puia dinghuensis TaxID=1792502 RepID=A0A8J2UCC2_9BACT|nr:tRNA (adenosine(37)-N6)-dimethylallyltransferase MiaA [Puia dinghuensis]GGA97514.1 tRNA dimethylallyltransferase 1 [Puia dinghuensis]
MALTAPIVIIVVGPTAVGKTAAAIRLARHFKTKIISADSRQCYRELNIGVAKPSPAELEAVHHYFINSHSIEEEVNAATFEELALGWAADIFRTAPVAVMVGGTGLYIRAFTDGLDTIPPVDQAIRSHIRFHYEERGLTWLQEEVKKYDPAFYEQGEIQNPQRLMRALEVRMSTGQSILSFRTREPRTRPFTIRTIGLQLPKEQLHQRINQRVDAMMEAGLLNEVKSLLPYRNHNALQTVGYKELFDHLDGKHTLAEAVTAIKTNTRQYAKRQLTWFRRDLSVRWADPATPLETLV